jgi:hypothetical protein
VYLLDDVPALPGPAVYCRPDLARRRILVSWEELRMLEAVLLFAGGVLAGSVGGLLGIGGGIILMPLLRFPVGLSPAYAAGTCVLAVAFTSLGGSYRHYRLGHVGLRPLVSVITAGALATIVFSVAFQYLATRERWLDLGLGLVFSLVSLRMIIEVLWKKTSGPSTGNADSRAGPGLGGTTFQKAVIGATGGMLPGLLGIGTGVILVPSFAYALGAPIKVAVGSSLACFSVNALISASAKLAQGFVRLDIALPVCLGTLVGANWGATLNKRFPSALIRLLFGVVFLYVSLKFILTSFEVRI